MDSSDQIIISATNSLRLAGCDSPAREARLMLAHILNIDANKLLAYELPVSACQLHNFMKLLERRLKGEPIAYILGTKEFWSLDFYVNSHTLCPRPDSESLIEAALLHIADKNGHIQIVDLGTGSGCLLLTLLHELPHAYGLGVDVSLPALMVAQKNAKRLGLIRRAAFVCSDWALAITGKFDMILSNPPYIETDNIAKLMPTIREFEPKIALDGGCDGLDAYRNITAIAPGLLKPGGILIFELGENQSGAVRNMAQKQCLRHIGTYNDLAGKERAIAFRYE